MQLLGCASEKVQAAACRMIEVWSEPESALTDLAMAQWEEASVITVRGNVAAEGTNKHPIHHSILPCTPSNHLRFKS